MRTVPSVRSLLLAAIVLTFLVLSMQGASFAQIGISVTIGPPALPVYEQPPCPDDGYLWTPGYWAYEHDYYWVPGTWVRPPEVGVLWTPGWWGWGGSAFLFHEGYWGPHIGFYGGINYGFGYAGVGFEGGRWDGGHFFYNRSVTNINVTNIHNVYNKKVINNTTVNRVSYNGGDGGITVRATAEEEAAERDRHVGAVEAQTQNREAARNDPQQHASANQGKPPVAATPRAGELHDREAVPAKEAGAPYHPAEQKGQAAKPSSEQEARPENNAPRPSNAVHPNDLPPRAPHAAPNTGNPKLDQKYQQQEQRLDAKQDQERQKLQQQQDQEHQSLAKQNANDARKQQVEQRHQQQTQQLQQRHEQQQQKMQQRQQPRSPKK